MKPEKEMHNTALRRQDKLNRLAKERLRVADGKVEKYQAVTPARDIEAFIAAENLANPDSGDLVAGKGVYLGTYTLPDDGNNSLKKVFNVYAAPEDLLPVTTYAGTLKHVEELKKWHGYDGTSYIDAVEIYAALRNGTYNGGWFIPPRELIDGSDKDRKATTPDNLLAHHDKGDFKGTFRRAGGGSFSEFYWTSTKSAGGQLHAFAMNKGILWAHSTNCCSCRLVRLELKL